MPFCMTMIRNSNCMYIFSKHTWKQFTWKYWTKDTIKLTLRTILRSHWGYISKTQLPNKYHMRISLANLKLLKTFYLKSIINIFSFLTHFFFLFLSLTGCRAYSVFMWFLIPCLVFHIIRIVHFSLVFIIFL